MLATIAVCAAAVVGDTALQAVKRRTGHRPGTRLITPLLAASATATITGILLAHLNRPLSLDGWTGLAGSLLLPRSRITTVRNSQAPNNRATGP